MKTKTIKSILAKTFSAFADSITDATVKALVEKNSIITGGAIASMLLQEDVNDFDIYFTNRETAKAVAEYYVNIFNCESNCELKIDAQEDRIRIVTNTGHRGATEGKYEVLTEPGTIEDTFQDAENNALKSDNEEGKPKYRPVFLSTNAITLTNKIQIVIRFFGEPDEIHGNYDFVHCTNYWTSRDDQLVLRPDALEALLTRELRYIGSKYPVCSVIRLRKFIGRKWTVNAGQILKMLMQISDLDLTDPKVLEEQLTGVDSAYFFQLIAQVKEKDPQKINTAYLVEIIDRLF